MKRSKRVYVGFVLISACLFLLVTMLLVGNPSGGNAVEGVRPLLKLDYLAPWSAYMGDLPRKADGSYDETAVVWRPLQELQQTDEAKSYLGVFWIKYTLPHRETPWRDPYLYVQRHVNYEAYLGDSRIGGFDIRYERFTHPAFSWRMYAMPAGLSDRPLLIRIQPRLPGLWIGEFRIGESTALIGDMLRYGAIPLTYVLIFGALGIVSAFVYLRSGRDPLFFLFAVITFSAALAYLARLQLIQLVPHSNVLVYFGELPGVVAVAAFLVFLDRFSPGSPLGVWYRRLALAILLFVAVCMAVAIIYDHRTSMEVYRTGLLPTLALVAVLSIHYCWRKFREGTDIETGWVITGMLSAVFFTVVHIVGLHIENLIYWGGMLSPYFYLFDNAAGFGVVLFVISLANALLARLSRIREEHRLFTLDLERLVGERTAELEEASILLEQSIRERTEAMAELSVLEERNRIARDIHDVVGHTLTTTLVQIEAAKRLIHKGKPQGLERLDLSMELVRRSLADMRDSVHMMQSGGAEFDLLQSIRELTGRTEAAAGIEVSGTVDELPPLSMLQKKVLFHALQEGLTNGIRHGEAKRFRYRLQRDGGDVTLQLWNDGKPPAGTGFGFGLTNMNDRVRQLGGALEVQSPDGGGYLLSVRFPAG
ncbi:histidine kinase [Paenibacillus chartarius]|uniref:histidine kinase n=1 Tax=Paenibacillus chartarius TaxID=747481 RepID=A0ABV6DU39_9BACL